MNALRKVVWMVTLTASATVLAESAGQRITPAGGQSSMTAPQQYFSGAARIDPLFPGTEAINASGAYVTFEPGARSAWHAHPKGQHIIVTQGVGLTQEWGKEIRRIKPGDVVWCPPGVKHWHGAAPDTAMTHLVVTGQDADGDNVTWMDKVTDAQYSGQAATGLAPGEASP